MHGAAAALGGFAVMVAFLAVRAGPLLILKLLPVRFVSGHIDSWLSFVYFAAVERTH